MKNSLCYFLFLCFILVHACRNQEAKSNKLSHDSSNSSDTINDTILQPELREIINNERYNYYNDFAKFVAGLPSKTQSLLDSLRNTDEWKRYAFSFDSSWRIVEQNRLLKMAKWSDVEFANFKNESKDVLYPFSGPDFLHVFTFFPNAQNYVLIALEPVGDYIDFRTKNSKFIKKYLSNVQNSLNDLFKKSYFITMNMIGDLQKDKVNGVLPLICLFMARTGNEILDIKRIEFNENGDLLIDSLTKNNHPNKITAIKIDFINQRDPKNPRSLYYFRADLSDNALKYNIGLQKFLDGFQHTIGYFKSASYLAHYREFSMIRTLMLEKCDYIIQDDTGIPYRFFDKNKWEIQLYGKYVKPVKDFSGVEQLDLRRAYENDTTVKALPFSLGYHWGTQNQNLMKFARKNLK